MSTAEASEGRRTPTAHPGASGDFVELRGERWYAIRDVDRLRPFMATVVSSDDHWFFCSSAGGVTAGRVSKESALFPFVTVDKLHEVAHSTGGISLVSVAGAEAPWQPFGPVGGRGHSVERNLYKNVLANKLCYEEINHDLGLAWRCTWLTSDRFGIVRHCEIENRSGDAVRLDLIDGIQNILPAGVQSDVQASSSNLVNAYRWTELDEDTGLATYSLYAGITDRAMPCESLRANTAFCLDLEGHSVLLSSAQLESFRDGVAVQPERHKRGVRGAYLVHTTLELAPGERRSWRIVADVDYSQAQVVALRRRLAGDAAIGDAVTASVDAGADELARIMGASDAFQSTAWEMDSAHHYANVLFNVLRGGIFADQYRIPGDDFRSAVAHFNREAFRRNEDFLGSLPQRIDSGALLQAVVEHGDPDLERLARDYLPITFGRRHGDPSRPWNRFNIVLRDRQGKRLLSYEGNWRDIFQNWEALLFSYPEFVESVIAKFVNASTPDGHNPYRITKGGIDWEVEDPHDPWSYIGYWGDHQIIYLTKLLEWSARFHPGRLRELLRRPVFSYANVPYRIKPFEALLEDPKHTVDFDSDLADAIDRRVAEVGADGKLVPDADGGVVRVNLAEKLLVPVLAKLCNLVVDGGIWLNTQRPEWNDANNALVGNGLSMVTMYYLHRHLRLLREIFDGETETFDLSVEVARWLQETAAALAAIRGELGDGPVDADTRAAALSELGRAAERYRSSVYAQGAFAESRAQSVDDLLALLDDALAVIRHSIATNRREDGLFHAYNLLRREGDGLAVDRLYPMLEGQVAALSAGCVDAGEAAKVLDALYASAIYRPDQKSFMLYPDRALPGFLDKNRIPEEDLTSVPALARLAADGEGRLIVRDDDGQYRFDPDIVNAQELDRRLDLLADSLGDELGALRGPLHELYEKVFSHRQFTGRSGTMFGFEGLGCIYWHMVSKLLLAVQENFFAALEDDTPRAERERLGRLYYRVRDGLGFNKTPVEYGAFPADPYSHTPGHAGARQPGMTGQVKEEVLARFGELGVRIRDGAARFVPTLLRRGEFPADERRFRYLDVEGEWQEMTVPRNGLAFTWCQVPVVYRLENDGGAALVATLEDGSRLEFEAPVLPPAESAELFRRSGRIRRLDVAFSSAALFSDAGAD